VEQGKRAKQVEAERGSPDRTGTDEAVRRRWRSRRHSGGCAPVVANIGDGFLQQGGARPIGRKKARRRRSPKRGEGGGGVSNPVGTGIPPAVGFGQEAKRQGGGEVVLVEHIENKKEERGSVGVAGGHFNGRGAG
jgi:hypothetical protein